MVYEVKEVKMEMIPGTSIETASFEAWNYATGHKCDVSFNFNGYTVTIKKEK